MPCFYYSPNANASTKPENNPFTEAELGAHVLHMCPIQWQDQYNMNETPMDMRLLLTSLEAIERVCTYEKGKLDSYEKSEKSSNKGKKGKKCPDTNFSARVPKKVHFEKHCSLVYPPYYLDQVLGFWVICGSKKDVIMSWLMLATTSNCFPHPY